MDKQLNINKYTSLNAQKRIFDTKVTLKTKPNSCIHVHQEGERTLGRAADGVTAGWKNLAVRRCSYEISPVGATDAKGLQMSHWTRLASQRTSGEVCRLQAHEAKQKLGGMHKLPPEIVLVV